MDMNKQEYALLKKASKILLKISAKEFGECKEYAFHCISCEVFDLATKFDSFVNFYLEPPMTKKEEAKALRKQLALIKKIENGNKLNDAKSIVKKMKELDKANDKMLKWYAVRPNPWMRFLWQAL